MLLGRHLSTNGVYGYQIFVGKYDADAKTHIFLAMNKNLDLKALPETLDNVPIILLSIKKSKPSDRSVFLKA
jgi:hypothetical protein